MIILLYPIIYHQSPIIECQASLRSLRKEAKEYRENFIKVRRSENHCHGHSISN